MLLKNYCNFGNDQYFRTMRVLIIYCITLCVNILLAGCSPLLYEQATYDTDDMYGVHSIEQILADKESRKREAEQIFTEARYEPWQRSVGYVRPIRWQFGVGYERVPYYNSYWRVPVPYYGWGWEFNYGWGYDPYFGAWWGYPYYGYGYPSYYYRPYYRPHYRNRSIVRSASPYAPPSSGASRRRVDGSTVGRTTGTTYNRGGSSSSYNQGGTTVRTQQVRSSGSSGSVSSPSSSSSSSSSGGRLNSIGR